MAGEADGGNLAGLGADEDGSWLHVVEVLRHLGALPGPSLRHEDGHSAVPHRLLNLSSIFVNGQGALLHRLIFVKLREREGQRVDLGRSLKGHL